MENMVWVSVMNAVDYKRVLHYITELIQKVMSCLLVVTAYKQVKW